MNLDKDVFYKISHETCWWYSKNGSENCDIVRRTWIYELHCPTFCWYPTVNVRIMCVYLIIVSCVFMDSGLQWNSRLLPRKLCFIWLHLWLSSRFLRPQLPNTYVTDCLSNFKNYCVITDLMKTLNTTEWILVIPIPLKVLGWNWETWLIIYRRWEVVSIGIACWTTCLSGSAPDLWFQSC